jgi:hypothetical protein
MTGLAVISMIADVVVALFAGAALVIGWRQVRISRELSALEAYEHYHLLCLQHPKFSGGAFGFEACSAQDRDSYCTFVLFALMTGERILNIFPRNESWRESIRDDIRIHRRLIRSTHFEAYKRNQVRPMSDLIDEVLAEPEEPPSLSAPHSETHPVILVERPA